MIEFCIFFNRTEFTNKFRVWVKWNYHITIHKSMTYVHLIKKLILGSTLYLFWIDAPIVYHSIFFAWWTNSGIWDKILRRGPFILFYAEKNLVPCKHVLVRVINQKLFLVVYYVFYSLLEKNCVHTPNIIIITSHLILFLFC